MILKKRGRELIGNYYVSFFMPHDPQISGGKKKKKKIVCVLMEMVSTFLALDVE